MGRKSIRTIFKIDTFSLVECNDGFWLYDYVLNWSIAAHCKTEQEAYIEALLYYQKYLADTKKELAELRNKVDTFVSQFVEKNEDDEQY